MIIETQSTIIVFDSSEVGSAVITDAENIATDLESAKERNKDIDLDGLNIQTQIKIVNPS